MSIQELNGLNGIGTEAQFSADSALSVYDIRHLLSNRRRDLIIHHMAANDGRAEFSELVDVVAEDVYGEPVDTISGEDRHKVYISLYQSHLPKLQDAKIIDYERKSGEMWFGEAAEDVLAYLKSESSRSLVDRVRDGMMQFSL